MELYNYLFSPIFYSKIFPHIQSSCIVLCTMHYATSFIRFTFIENWEDDRLFHCWNVVQFKSAGMQLIMLTFMLYKTFQRVDVKLLMILQQIREGSPGISMLEPWAMWWSEDEKTSLCIVCDVTTMAPPSVSFSHKFRGEPLKIERTMSSWPL